MKRTRLWWVLAGIILSFPLLGSCSSSGDECDVCTSDEECKAPLVCSSFAGEATKRCGTGLGGTVCRVH
jgi:hypothetical protein